MLEGGIASVQVVTHKQNLRCMPDCRGSAIVVIIVAAIVAVFYKRTVRRQWRYVVCLQLTHNANLHQKENRENELQRLSNYETCQYTQPIPDT